MPSFRPPQTLGYTRRIIADFIGLRLMSKACFDPREAPQMWVRMESADTQSKSGFGGVASQLDFASTHPANQKRIKALEKWLPQALDVRAASDCADTIRQFERFASTAGAFGGGGGGGPGTRW